MTNLKITFFTTVALATGVAIGWKFSQTARPKLAIESYESYEDTIAVDEAGSDQAEVPQPKKVKTEGASPFNTSEDRSSNEVVSASEPSSAENAAPVGVVESNHEFPEDEEILDLAATAVAPGGEVDDEEQNADGTLVTKARANDGGTIIRTYDPSGLLTTEVWERATGDEIRRSFIHDGSMKDVLWKHENGTTTTATFGSSGQLTGRIDDLPDGRKISTGYDENGQAVDRWMVEQDGKSMNRF